MCRAGRVEAVSDGRRTPPGVPAKEVADNLFERPDRLTDGLGASRELTDPRVRDVGEPRAPGLASGARTFSRHGVEAVEDQLRSIVGMDALDQESVDAALVRCDGTEQLERLVVGLPTGDQGNFLGMGYWTTLPQLVAFSESPIRCGGIISAAAISASRSCVKSWAVEVAMLMVPSPWPARRPDVPSSF